MSERPDAESFEVGCLYRHDYTGDVAEFLGTALMPELDGEDVCLFQWVDGSGYIVATNHSWAYGETFTRVSGDEVTRIA